MIRFLPSLALLLTACAPQNAVLTSGEYFAFVSDNTSFSLQKGVVDPYDWGDEMWTIDCRNFADNKERKALQLSGIADDCEQGDDRAQCVDRRLTNICEDWVDVPQSEQLVRPLDESWIGQSPWWVLHEELDAWRGEAVITSEDDLQVGFHHRLPGGEDFRFAFVVDPDFAPKRCNINTGEPEELDGNWLANWTADASAKIAKTPGMEHMAKYAETGSVYFINADGFQFNPDDTLDYWFMPEQWEAGWVSGKFSEETFQSRAPRWGLNEVYEYFEVYDPTEGYAVPPSLSELYFCELAEGEDPLENDCMAASNGLIQDLADIRYLVQDDLSSAMSPNDNFVNINTASVDALTREGGNGGPYLKGMTQEAAQAIVDGRQPPAVLDPSNPDADNDGFPDKDEGPYADCAAAAKAAGLGANAASSWGADCGTGPSWSPIEHLNLWRPSDGIKSGFDGWGELHYNIVAFDKTPEQMAKIQKGDALKGAFVIVADGLDSNSRFLLRGEFEIKKVKADRWTTKDLRAEKLEENGNSLCVLQ